ncbi:hypothetical protein [Kitasatospora sp. NPDC093806]|uniref:hypothetical protein n=1 Tax=Kitasatospora sp. NPDC093806 TaxID=3155075 RepID=UPI003423CC8B
MRVPFPAGPLNRVLVLLLAAALLTTAGFVTYRILTDRSCGTGVAKHDGEECVGVTDGGFVFHQSLKQVSEQIKAENDKLAGKSVATVALMIPMVSTSPAEQQEYLEQVQGAYLAQHRANSQDNQPPIRLVLANPGRAYKQWRTVAEQLAEAAADEKQNLRAVTGLNISLPETKEAVRYLTKERGIPVVAGPMTADDIRNTTADPRAFPGLAHVAPSNGDQATVLAAYGAATKPGEALLIKDLRENDNYLSSLRASFEKLTKDAPYIPQPYRSPADDVNDKGNLANEFRRMMPEICAATATTVYFAGRPVQLRQFLIELSGRPCPEKAYTVITGSHASTLLVDPEFTAHWDMLSTGKGITVRYTALAHPDTWGPHSTEATGGSKKATQELYDLLPKPEPGAAERAGLADGRVIITYDAVTTAVEGIRKSTVGDVKMPSTAQVANSWLRMRGDGRVDGASGWICLDETGNPYNKAIPIVRLDPTAKTAVLEGVAWPSGHAPDAKCSTKG